MRVTISRRDTADTTQQSEWSYISGRVCQEYGRSFDKKTIILLANLALTAQFCFSRQKPPQYIQTLEREVHVMLHLMGYNSSELSLSQRLINLLVDCVTVKPLIRDTRSLRQPHCKSHLLYIVELP